MSAYPPSSLLLGLLVVSVSLAAPSSAEDLSPKESEALISSLLAIPFPSNATDLHCVSFTAFTTVVDARFSCKEADLLTLLKNSPHLNGSLASGNRALTNRMGTAEWWNPDGLIAPKSLTTEWQQGKDTVSCRLMAGRIGPQEQRLVVYVSFVLERK